MTARRVYPGLSADQVHRLYEAMTNVAEAIPAEQRNGLMAVWRRPAWQLPDTDRHRRWRSRLLRQLSDLVRPDWRYIIAMLRSEPGAATVLTQWGTDAGYFNRSST